MEYIILVLIRIKHFKTTLLTSTIVNFIARLPDMVVDELPTPINEREPGILSLWSLTSSAGQRNLQHPMEEVNRRPIYNDFSGLLKLVLTLIIYKSKYEITRFISYKSCYFVCLFSDFKFKALKYTNTTFT